MRRGALSTVEFRCANRLTHCEPYFEYKQLSLDWSGFRAHSTLASVLSKNLEPKSLLTRPHFRHGRPCGSTADKLERTFSCKSGVVIRFFPSEQYKELSALIIKIHNPSQSHHAL